MYHSSILGIPIKFLTVPFEELSNLIGELTHSYHISEAQAQGHCSVSLSNSPVGTVVVPPEVLLADGAVVGVVLFGFEGAVLGSGVVVVWLLSSGGHSVGWTSMDSISPLTGADTTKGKFTITSTRNPKINLTCDSIF